MTKKEFIIAVLSKLVGKWVMAHTILTLIQNNKLNDKNINLLSDIVRKVYREVKTNISIERMTKMQTILKSLEKNEKKSQKMDSVNLDALLATI